MKKSESVLVVGNCGADDSAIRSMLQRNFSVEIEQASSVQDATRQIENREFDLVMVNRVFDATGEPGIEFIATQKAIHPDLPMMLISNYADAQQQAVAAGAVTGFGKSAIRAADTIELIRGVLGSG